MEEEESQKGGLTTSDDIDIRTKYKEGPHTKKPRRKIKAVKNRQREVKL